MDHGIDNSELFFLNESATGYVDHSIANPKSDIPNDSVIDPRLLDQATKEANPSIDNPISLPQEPPNPDLRRSHLSKPTTPILVISRQRKKGSSTYFATREVVVMILCSSLWF